MIGDITLEFEIGQRNQANPATIQGCYFFWSTGGSTLTSTAPPDGVGLLLQP